MLDVISLLVTFVLFMFSVHALGMSGLLILPRVKPYDLEASGRKLRYFAAIFSSGIIINYLCGLLFVDLGRTIFVNLVFCFAGAIIYLKVHRDLLNALRFNIDWISFCLISIIGILISAQIIFEPLYGADARSIWFFHAKIIHHLGGLYLNDIWEAVDFPFSHIDYPKTISYLAAQFAYIAGFWNEYLPKWSLLLLLVPALLGLFSFYERKFSFLLLVLLFFVPGSLLWNGYMDGYLAIYAGLAALFALDWLESGNRVDLISAVAFLAVVSSLKNEGLVLAGVIVVCLLPAIWRKFCSRQPERVKLGSLFQAALCLLMAFGVALLWVWLRQRHGFVNDLSFSSKSLDIIGSRVAETESLLTIAHLMLTASGLWQVIVVAVITGILCRVVCRNICPVVLIVLAMASLYAMILVMVYLSTPYDLVWHLLSSAPRTTLPVIFLLGISIYRLMRQIEYVDPAPRLLEANQLTE